MNPNFSNFPKSFKPLQEEDPSTEQPKVNFPSSFKPIEEKTQFQKDQELIEEDLDPEIERHIARLTSRGIEQGVGFLGNMRDFAYAVKDFYTKHKPEALKNIPEPESFKKFDEAIPIFKTVSKVLDYLPTSADVKKFSEEKTLGYTKPQNDYERVGDEVFEKIVSSSMPGMGQRNVWKNIAAPVFSTLGKEGVKALGVGEKGQLLTELGLNLVIPLAAGNAPQLNKNLWKDIERNTPNVSVNAGLGRQRATNLVAKLENEGLGSAGEKKVISALNQFLDNTKNGQMSAKQLVGFNRSINEIRGDPELLSGSKKLLNEVSSIVKDTGTQFERVAPDFYKEWKKANEIHGAIVKSDYVAKVVEKMSDRVVSEGARTLFAGALHAGAAGAASVPPVYAIYKMTQVMDRVARSPELMRYYTGVLTNSIKGNANLAAQNLTKLDQALLKEERRAKPPFNNQTQKKKSS